jgi:DNA-binding FadR family transcriptional regulator
VREESDHDWIEPAVRVKATDQIRLELTRAIRDGRFPVSTKLPSEAELARRFKVSRPVIREALGSLRALGLTASYTGRGTFVVSSEVKLPLALGDVSSEDLHEVRVCLEVPAARLAASRRSEVDLRALRISVDRFSRFRTTKARVDEDVRFHTAIATASQNVLLQRLVGEMREVLREQSLALAAVTGRRNVATSEHRSIFEAVLAGQADEAAEAMRSHLAGVHSAVDEL